MGSEKRRKKEEEEQSECKLGLAIIWWWVHIFWGVITISSLSWFEFTTVTPGGITSRHCTIFMFF